MKFQREQDLRDMKGQPGNPLVKSAKQKQIDYLKQIKFNGYTSTQSQSNMNGGMVVNGSGAALDNVREKDIVRDLLFVFQGIEGKLIQFSFAEDAFIL